MTQQQTKTFTILGATGNVGGAAAKALLAKGHTVRVVGRDVNKLEALAALGAEVHAIDVHDTKALANALRGVHGAFLMTPPEYGAADFRAAQKTTAAAIAEATQAAEISFAVHLSSLGAEVPEGTGPIAGLYIQEARLSKIPGLATVHLRPGSFFQNLFWQVPTLQHHGVLATAVRADLPVWMVDAEDIGKKAAELLERGATKTSVFEFTYGKPYTYEQVVELLRTALERPELANATPSYAEEVAAMHTAGGMPLITAQVMGEMSQAMNDGKIRRHAKPEREHSAPTSLEQFLPRVVAAYRAK